MTPVPETRVILTRTAFLIALLVLLGLPAVGALLAQDEGGNDDQEQIAAVIQRYGSRTLTDAWQGARILEEFDEAAIPACRSLLQDGTPRQKLMASKTLIALESTQRVSRTLRGIAGDESVEVEERAAAIQLLVDFPDQKTKDLLTGFLEGEEAFNPELRIAAAKTLFLTHRDRLARSSLMPLLTVDDVDRKSVV